MRQIHLLTAILSALTGLVFLASGAVPATTAKGKAAPKQASTIPKKPATTVATKGKAPAAVKSKAAVATKSKAPASNNSKAVYSRSGRTSQTVRRGVTAAKPQTNWQSRPTQDRYREIQQSLADKGFFKGEVNGTWSADSVQALKEFQRAENLDPDGKLGSLSLIALGLGPKRIVAANNGASPQPQPPPATPEPVRQP